MTTIENNQLRVSIRPQGAELTGIFYKPTATEHLWQADPTVWGWHAPNLFPIVGGLLNDELHVGGETYPMKRHGFARQSLFVETESSDSHAIFALRSNDKTWAVYPYEFEFQISYELTDASLSVTYRVVNEGDAAMYFSVGAHPAFNVPFVEGEAYSDYVLEFEQDEALVTHQLSEAGLFSGETRPVPITNRQLALTPNLFDQDALVFKNIKSRRVSLKHKDHDRAVTVSFLDFPHLGIWAKPGAPFVCIEPWLGYADAEGAPTPVERKGAIQHLDAGDVFAATFTIGIA
ncbi:aldose 1-epimerase family protein [Spirosoma arcticum]